MPLMSSIKVRLAVSLGVVAIASALFLSQYASTASRRQIERDQSALLQNIAVRMTSQLAHDMSTRANEILFLTGHDRIRDPKYPVSGKREIFERIRQAYPFYAWVGMTDAEGNIVAGTDGLLVGKSVAQRDWFLKGKEGLHFGDAHDAFLLAKMLPKPKWDDLPLRLVDLSAPVYDASGKLLGVICGHLSLDWAFEVRESMLDQLARDNLDLIVLNKDGKVLMGTPQLPSLKVDLASLKAYQGLSSNTRQVGVETWPDGNQYLTATVREASFRNYPGMGWAIVARRGEAAAFAPADELSRQILLGGIATSVLFVMLLWGLLNKHLGPLTAIADAAREMKEGNRDVTIPQPEGQDELAVFARSLIGLTNSLSEKNDELRLASRVFDESGQGILISDANNYILRVNRAFTRITGYAESDVVGNTPAMLQSGRQKADYYQEMWQSLNRKGSWQGEIWNRTKSGHIYPEWLTINTLKDANGTLTNFIGIFDDITLKKDYEHRLVHLANYDSLTDLPNRNLMQIEVERMIDDSKLDGKPLALLFIDLDKFKHINDTLGHPAGDMVLKEVAARFATHAASDCLLARWGGDEFVLAMANADATTASNLAKKLVESLQRPFSIDGSRYHISMSTGVALYPTDGESVDQLLRCADTAMYRAKQDGSNHYRFYDSTMNAGVERFLKIDNALRHALDNGGLGLSLAFQPQWSSDGKTILSAEALIRWTHSELGTVSPSELIPVAEDTGQIQKLGQWIIHEAIRGYGAVVKAGCSPIPISINCSAYQLRDVSLARTLHTACLAGDMPSHHLMVEVTESAIMSDEFKVMDTLTALKSLGYKISVDDFGTGYSCLNYIQKIRPAEVKVDQGFVSTMLSSSDSRSIITFTHGLATSLGMDIVAEGVETQEQLAALLEIGTFKLQGYLLAKPMPMDDFITLLR